MYHRLNPLYIFMYIYVTPSQRILYMYIFQLICFIKSSTNFPIDVTLRQSQSKSFTESHVLVLSTIVTYVEQNQ